MSKRRRAEEDCKSAVTSDCKCGKHCMRTFSLQTVMNIRIVIWSMVGCDQNEHILKTLTKYAVTTFDKTSSKELTRLRLVPADLIRSKANTSPSARVLGASADDADAEVHAANAPAEHDQQAERQSEECTREVRNHRTHQTSFLTDRVPDARYLGCVQILGAVQPERQPKNDLLPELKPPHNCQWVVVDAHG